MIRKSAGGKAGADIKNVAAGIPLQPRERALTLKKPEQAI